MRNIENPYAQQKNYFRGNDNTQASKSKNSLSIRSMVILILVLLSIMTFFLHIQGDNHLSNIKDSSKSKLKLRGSDNVNVYTKNLKDTPKIIDKDYNRLPNDVNNVKGTQSPTPSPSKPPPIATSPPTPSPTKRPTPTPTPRPTPLPTRRPTNSPTLIATSPPTPSPTINPTVKITAELAEKSELILLAKPQLELISNNNSTGKLPQKSRHIEVNPQRKIEENNKKSEVDFNVDFLKSRFSEVELEKVQHLEIMKDVNMPIKNNPTLLSIPKIDPIIDNSSPKFDIKLGNIPPVLNKPTSETKTTNEIKFDTILGDILKPPVKLDSQDVLNLSPIKPPKFDPPIPLSPPKFDANFGEHILISAPRKHEDFIPPSIKTDVLTGYTLDQELEKKINAEIRKDETDRENQINSEALKKKVIAKPQEEEFNCDGDVDPFIGQPVESFTPPKKSDLKSKLKWNEAVSEMLAKIKGMKTGGEALRLAIKSEISILQELRIDLFCKHV